MFCKVEMILSIYMPTKPKRFFTLISYARYKQSHKFKISSIKKSPIARALKIQGELN